MRYYLLLFIFMASSVLCAGPITKDSKEAADRGERWLKSIQSDSGGWPCEKGAEDNISITSIASLAIAANNGMLDGDVKSGVRFVVKHADGMGYITTYDTTNMGVLYDHSMALLMMSQFVGNANIRGLKDSARLSVRKLVEAQGKSGGWLNNIGYTGVAFSALKSLQESGVSIEADLSKAISFANRSYGKGFMKNPQEPGHYKRFFFNAAGLRVIALQDSNNRSDAIKKLAGIVPGKQYAYHGGDEGRIRKETEFPRTRIAEWDYAGMLLAIQGMLQQNEADWKPWYKKIRDQLIRKQNPDGSWEVEYCEVCRGYATSVAVLFLRAPNFMLPMFKRSGK